MSKFDELTLNTVRDIVFIEEVSNESAKELVRQISIINHVDDEMERITEGLVNPYVRDNYPIVIRLMTGGGSVHAGFAIANAIKTSTTPILVIASGVVASMGLYIMASAHARVADDSVEFMYHQVSSGNHGKRDDHRQHLNMLDRLQDKYDSFLVSRSNGKLTKEFLQEKRDSYHDFWFTAQEAKEMGLIDAILTDEELYNPQMSDAEKEQAIEDVSTQLEGNLAQLYELTGQRFKLDVQIDEETKDKAPIKKRVVKKKEVKEDEQQS